MLQPSPFAGSQIVLVEDDADLLSALAFAFETEGFIVRACRDGAAAMALLPFPPRACLIFDERLARQSGLDLLARLRDCGATCPAILITTHPTAQTRARAAAAGVEIVEKPLLGDALGRKVREALWTVRDEAGV